jgi:IclR family transcriptional regulator, acetate operon repressor
VDRALSFDPTERRGGMARTNGVVRKTGEAGADGAGPQVLVRSVARALQILEVMSDGPATGLTLSEVSRALGISKSAALVTLRTLNSFGYVRQVGTGPHYKLGMNLVRLGDVAASGLRLTEVCAGALRDLAEVTGQTVRLAISDDGYPVFVDRVDGSGAVRFHTPLGGRELPHSTAAGKAILATLPSDRVNEIARETGLARRTPNTIVTLDRLHEELDRVRDLGYAVDDEEDAEGVICIGAAIVGHGTAAAGALSMTSLKFDTEDRVAELGRIVADCAGRSSTLLSGRPSGDLRP